MKYSIKNTANIEGLKKRGFICNFGGEQLGCYWIKFIDRAGTEWGIELGNKVTDDGFITYCVFRRDTVIWGLLHTAMILLRDIPNPDHAMDLFTQLLHGQKTKI